MTGENDEYVKLKACNYDLNELLEPVRKKFEKKK